MALGPGLKEVGGHLFAPLFCMQLPGMACGGFLPPAGTSYSPCSLPEPPAAEACSNAAPQHFLFPN